MVVVFGTLGFTPEKFLPSLRHHAPIEAVHVFHDSAKESQEAAKEVETYCNDVGVTCYPTQVDAFDIVEAATTMRRYVRKYDRGQVVLNITGGTAILSCAALLVAVLDGVRAETVDLRDLKKPPEALPLLTISYKELLTDAQRRVLRAIAEAPGDVSQRDLVETLGLRKATVSHHVKTLKQRGLVRGESAEDGRMEYLIVPPSADLLLADDPPGAD